MAMENIDENMGGIFDSAPKFKSSTHADPDKQWLYAISKVLLPHEDRVMRRMRDWDEAVNEAFRGQGDMGREEREVLASLLKEK
ncbi:hypothetical protein AGMMS50256_28150 [Betaproteobacteria bacterium]|nr:hypothetical protein AGMMS50256_28150 [Betaproteobacteria bacterium]